MPVVQGCHTLAAGPLDVFRDTQNQVELPKAVSKLPPSTSPLAIRSAVSVAFYNVQGRMPPRGFGKLPPSTSPLAIRSAVSVASRGDWI